MAGKAAKVVEMLNVQIASVRRFAESTQARCTSCKMRLLVREHLDRAWEMCKLPDNLVGSLYRCCHMYPSSVIDPALLAQSLTEPNTT